MVGLTPGPEGCAGRRHSGALGWTLDGALPPEARTRVGQFAADGPTCLELVLQVDAKMQSMSSGAQREGRVAVDLKVTRWAERHHGLVTRAQAVRLGCSPDQIDYRVRTGRWRRLAPCVYAIAGSPETFEQRALAACLSAGPGAMVSHRSAGAVWGYSGCDRARRRGAVIEVLVPHRNGRRRSVLAVIHRSRRLGAADRTVINGLPVTSPARTLVDLAMPPTTGPQLSDHVDDAVCRRVVTVDRLRNRFRVVCGRGRAGTKALRAVLAGWGTDVGSTPESPPEAELERWMTDVGLGGHAQHEVVTQSGRRYRLDRAWPEANVALELDSFRWHGVPGRYNASLQRAAELRAEGWEVHAVTADQVARRDVQVQRGLEAALKRRMQAGAVDARHNGPEIRPQVGSAARRTANAQGTLEGPTRRA